jgi:hypothetical protein
MASVTAPAKCSPRLSRSVSSRSLAEKASRVFLASYLRRYRNRPEWAFGFEDETWFSRFGRPSSHSWVEAGRATRLIEKAPRKDDPEPKALACYGMYLPDMEQTWIRFVDGVGR